MGSQQSNSSKQHNGVALILTRLAGRPALRRLLRGLEMLAWATFFAFAALFLSLRYWLLPKVEHYREDIVAAISRAIDLPVKIGTLATDWQGLRPRLAISDVRVYDRDGREALALPLVENVVSWRTLFAGELRLHSFLIDSPKLAVRRDAKGDLYVAGIKISREEKGDGKLADWILSQKAIMIRGAEVEWRDELRNAPPLVLSALNFRLENDGDRHSVGISARPPRQLGPGVELRAELSGASLRQRSQWSGRVYAEAGYTDLAGWRPWVDYPLDVRRGEGALRLWATIQEGRVAQATADVALSNVAARLGKGLPALGITSVRGRVYGRETANGYDFGVRNLALVAPGAPTMNATSFRASWEPAAGSVPQRGSVTANLVELAPIAHLAEFFPFPSDLRKLLAELAPQGNLLDAKFEWTGQLPDEATYVAKTRFAGLSMNAWRSIPGFAGLSGSLDANEKKGVLHLASRKAALELPRIFSGPRAEFESLNGEFAWERPDAKNLAVRLSSVSFANEDLAGTASGTYAWTGEGPGTVDMQATLARLDARATPRYLPVAEVMGARTRDWVAGAVRGGQVSDVRLRLKGDLREFPYADPERGQFQIKARLSGAALEYASGWPAIDAIEGEMLFDREKIEVVGRSATILNAKLTGVRVTLPSMLAAQTQILIEGQAEGATSEFFDFIRQSPVRRMVSGATDNMSAIGRGKLRLKLDLPLAEMSKSKVAGEFQFSGNNITVDSRLPPIERAGGRVDFTESGMALHDVRGRLFGEDVAISGGTAPEGGIAVVARGKASVEGLRTVFDHPWRRRMTGASAYVATVTAREGRTQLSFTSHLEGVASSLPSPLAKTSAEALPLQVDIFPAEGRDRISILLGPPTGRIASAEFLRVAQNNAMQVQWSVITLNPAPGESPRIPERRGATVRGSLPALDLDRWIPILAEGGGGSGSGSGDGASFDLKVGILDAFGKRMRGVTMQGVVDGSGWSANMGTAEFAGDLVYRTEGAGRLVARLSRFMVLEDAPGTTPGTGVKDLPAVDVVAESFTHRNRKLGRVEIQARHEGRDWRIDKLAFTAPDYAMNGTGLWKLGQAPGSTPSRTSVDFKLAVSDVGKFLERLGYPEQVKGANGTLTGSVAWNGDPLSLDYSTLSGNLQMQALDGQFLEIEPGLGKLVSLMSLQMLPRRISLDFRDVFSKGFQFDRINGALGVERGVMDVKEFRMRGPAAEVNMSGKIDLSLETQTLAVKVIPAVGGIASTVVGLVNPVAGVAAMIANKLFKDPLNLIAAYDYAVTGTWTDPKIERVQQVSPPTTTMREGPGSPLNTVEPGAAPLPSTNN